MRSTLQAKEAELTRTMDQFLQEKVATAKAHGELNSLRGRLNKTQGEIEGLQRQISVLNASQEGAERERLREQELGELRRHCHQLQVDLQVRLKVLYNTTVYHSKA